MASESVVDQIVKSLSFEVEAVPQQEDVTNLTSTSNSTPLNVKIRVRKKQNCEMQQGFLSVPKFGHPGAKPERIRLISSDQTIMSFNVSMEADFVKKPKRKPRKLFFGGCLGTQYDDDEITYKPSSAYNAKITDTSTLSKSDGIIRQKFTLSKPKYDHNDDLQQYTKKQNILGKCKPGGCLDPPFSEEKYSYKPKQKSKEVKPSIIEDTIKTNIKNQVNKAVDGLKTFKESDKLSKDSLVQKAKADDNSLSILSLYDNSLQGSLDSKYSDSVITYKPLTSSSPISNEKNSKNKINTEEKLRKSYDDSIEAFFSSPKKNNRFNEKSSTGTDNTKREKVKTIVPIPVPIPLVNNTTVSKADESYVIAPHVQHSVSPKETEVESYLSNIASVNIDVLSTNDSKLNNKLSSYNDNIVMRSQDLTNNYEDISYDVNNVTKTSTDPTNVSKIQVPTFQSTLIDSAGSNTIWRTKDDDDILSYHEPYSKNDILIEKSLQSNLYNKASAIQDPHKNDSKNIEVNIQSEEESFNSIHFRTQIDDSNLEDLFENRTLAIPIENLSQSNGYDSDNFKRKSKTNGSPHQPKSLNGVPAPNVNSNDQTDNNSKQSFADHITAEYEHMKNNINNDKQKTFSPLNKLSFENEKLTLNNGKQKKSISVTEMTTSNATIIGIPENPIEPSQRKTENKNRGSEEGETRELGFYENYYDEAEFILQEKNLSPDKNSQQNNLKRTSLDYENNITNEEINDDQDAEPIKYNIFSKPVNEEDNNINTTIREDDNMSFISEHTLSMPNQQKFSENNLSQIESLKGSSENYRNSKQSNFVCESTRAENDLNGKSSIEDNDENELIKKEDNLSFISRHSLSTQQKLSKNNLSQTESPQGSRKNYRDSKQSSFVYESTRAENNRNGNSSVEDKNENKLIKEDDNLSFISRHSLSTQQKLSKNNLSQIESPQGSRKSYRDSKQSSFVYESTRAENNRNGNSSVEDNNGNKLIKEDDNLSFISRHSLSTQQKLSKNNLSQIESQQGSRKSYRDSKQSSFVYESTRAENNRNGNSSIENNNKNKLIGENDNMSFISRHSLLTQQKLSENNLSQMDLKGSIKNDSKSKQSSFVYESTRAKENLNGNGSIDDNNKNKLTREDLSFISSHSLGTQQKLSENNLSQIENLKSSRKNDSKSKQSSVVYESTRAKENLNGNSSIEDNNENKLNREDLSFISRHSLGTQQKLSENNLSQIENLKSSRKNNSKSKQSSFVNEYSRAQDNLIGNSSIDNNNKNKLIGENDNMSFISRHSLATQQKLSENNLSQIESLKSSRKNDSNSKQSTFFNESTRAEHNLNYNSSIEDNNKNKLTREDDNLSFTSRHSLPTQQKLSESNLAQIENLKGSIKNDSKSKQSSFVKEYTLAQDNVNGNSSITNITMYKANEEKALDMPIDNFELIDPITQPFKSIRNEKHHSKKKLTIENISTRPEQFGKGSITSSKLRLKSISERWDSKDSAEEKYKVSSKTSLKNDSISLDLAFQSYLNDRKERTLKTIDTSIDSVRYPDDSVTVIKSHLRPNVNEIRIPLDSDNDMTIQIHRTKSPTQHVQIIEQEHSGFKKPFPTLSNHCGLPDFPKVNNFESHSQEWHELNTGNEIPNILNSVYEQELIPLQKTINHLKKEVDLLASQQSIFIEKIVSAKRTKPIRLLRINSRCACFRK